MHELSLACSVVELVEKELALHGGGSVRCIEITIGDLSGVDNDAFLFSLNMVLERSAFAGAFETAALLLSFFKIPNMIPCSFQFS